mmetsp:Transcript_40682/g.88950  ORF Transcript_40682/g.88950 Transcript_40682/m.88950 type:complete len:219 (-) Transcript_40682:99-755(-)
MVQGHGRIRQSLEALYQAAVGHALRGLLGARWEKVHKALSLLKSVRKVKLDMGCLVNVDNGQRKRSKLLLPALRSEDLVKTAETLHRSHGLLEGATHLRVNGHPIRLAEAFQDEDKTLLLLAGLSPVRAETPRHAHDALEHGGLWSPRGQAVSGHLGVEAILPLAGAHVPVRGAPLRHVINFRAAIGRCDPQHCALASHAYIHIGIQHHLCASTRRAR